MSGKIVVFDTPALYGKQPVYEGQEPVFEHRCKNGHHDVFWSTGKLETALERGYEVYVVSIRWKLYASDKWWGELVGDDHTFYNALSAIGKYPASEMQVRLMSSWRDFYDRLGIEWNESFRDWDDPLIHLVTRHGIIDGSTLPGYAI